MSRFVPVLALLFALGCATSKSASSSPSEASPATAQSQGAVKVEELLAREKGGLSPQTVTVEGKSLQIVGAAAPKVEVDGEVTQITVPLGTDQPVECTVQRQPIDAGATLWRMLQAVIKDGKVQVASVRSSGVQIIEKEPALGLDAVYRVSSPEGDRVGELKLVSLSGDNVSVICIHDEPGFSKTFDGVMASVAGAVLRASPSPRPRRYVEISQIRIQDIVVGFTKEAIYDESEKPGETVSVHATSLIMPRSATDVMADDTVVVRQLDKAGRLNGVQWVHGVNGELAATVVAKRDGKNGYSYRGKHSGKDVSGAFKSEDKAGLPGDPIVRARIKELLAGKKKGDLKMQDYTPSTDFSAPTTTTYKRDPSAADLVTMETGPVAMKLKVDAKGMPYWGEMQLGPVKMLHERLFAEGSP